MKKFRAEGALLTATLIWGATFVIVKSALTDISPMLFVSFRFSFAALVLIPFIIKSFKVFNKKVLHGGLIVGIFYFLGFASQTIGLNFTSATKSGFITGTFVIFTPFFQLLIEKKKPAKENIFGIFLVLIGLIFLSSKGDSILDVFNEIGKGFNLGDFFTLLCAIFFALYIVYLDIESKKMDLMPLVFLQILVTGLCGFLFVFIFKFSGINEVKFSFTPNLIFALLYTSILATIVTTTLQTRFQKETTPTKASIIFSFEPIFSAVFAFFVLNEKISNFKLLGCLFIFTGLLAAELIKNKNIMSSNNQRAEIILTGLVQGVGFRYFVIRHAQQLGLKGYVKNLYDGSVLAVVEGEKSLIEDLFKKLKVGPRSASVNNAKIQWTDYKNEFSTFEIEY